MASLAYDATRYNFIATLQMKNQFKPIHEVIF